MPKIASDSQYPSLIENAPTELISQLQEPGGFQFNRETTDMIPQCRESHYFLNNQGMSYSELK